MLVAALLPLPYGYYTLLCLVVTVVFAWAACIAHANDRPVLPQGVHVKC